MIQITKYSMQKKKKKKKVHIDSILYLCPPPPVEGPFFFYLSPLSSETTGDALVFLLGEKGLPMCLWRKASHNQFSELRRWDDHHLGEHP
jgi:hypothetical protein